MDKPFLEAGKIVNTHGLEGDVKIQPWADSAAFLLDFSTLYIDGLPRKLISGRVHKNCLIARFDGVFHISAAIALKNKLVYINRADVKLEPGQFFIQDIIGLPVIDKADVPFGVLREILPRPAGDLYVIENHAGGEHLVPNVPAFILEKNLDKGYIRVNLIEGM